MTTFFSPFSTWALLGLPAARLPVALILFFGALGLAALVFLHQRGRRLQAGVDEEFKRFREEAVRLMDQIDALRQRHKTLPSTDPDFTEPMAGATLALYNQVSADLDRLWERWLNVMEVWNQAEQRMRSASRFGSNAPSEEARQMLAAGGLEELLRRSSDCKADLDRLNLAHETASKAMKEARLEIAETERTTFGGARTQEAAANCRRTLDEAATILTADPIGAADRVEAARRALAEAGNRATPPPPLPPRSGSGSSSRSIFDDLSAAASRLQELAANLRVTDIVGLLIKGWVALWVLGLFLVILPFLMPLILVFMGFVVIASGLRAFQHMSGPLDWGGPHRRRRRRW